MKKLISIFLTVIILIMSVFSVSASAQEQTRTEKWIESDSKNEIEFTASYEVGFNKTEFHAHLKNGKLGITLYVPLSEIFSVKIKMIYDGEYLYVYSPVFPFVHFKSPADEITDILTSYDDYPIQGLDFVGSYEEKDIFSTLYVEEFRNENDEFAKYYFNGDILRKIETCYFDENGNQVSGFVNIKSYNVSDKELRVPWYSFCFSTAI